MGYSLTKRPEVCVYKLIINKYDSESWGCFGLQEHLFKDISPARRSIPVGQHARAEDDRFAVSRFCKLILRQALAPTAIRIRLKTEHRRER